jgi:hypothetical protein
MAGIGINENNNHVPKNLEFEVMYSTHYLDAWWWFFFCNLYLIGSGVFIISFLHFPKVADGKD